MDLSKIEAFATSRMKTAYLIASEIAENKPVDFKLFYGYHLALANEKHYDIIFDNKDVYYKILKFILTGKITVDGDLFDFSDFVKDEEKEVRSMFYLVTSYLISIEFIETKNLYKAVTNQSSNNDLIFKEVINNNDDDETLDLNTLIAGMLYDKMSSLLKIIYRTA